MKGVRKEYLARLIKGVREQRATDPDTIQAQKDCGGYEDVTIARWIDASILCDVIEEEVLSNKDIPTIDKRFHWEHVVGPHHREIRELIDCIAELKTYTQNLERKLNIDVNTSVEMKKARTILVTYDYKELGEKSE